MKPLLKSLLVEIYGPRVGATLLCGRQKTLPEDYFDGDLALCRRTFFCRFRLSARWMLSQSNS